MEFPTIISYSNYGYSDFAKIMLFNLNNTIKSHKIHFYCLDQEMFDELTSWIPQLTNITITFELVNISNISKNFEQYGSQSYNAITHTKMNILKNALRTFEFIHFIDCDVVCIKEPPSSHYKKYKSFDVVFQHDAGMYSATKLHAPTLHHIWCCTGNTTFRNTPQTHRLLDIISTYQHKYQYKNDQECLYQYFEDCNVVDLREYTEANLFTYEIEEYTNGYWLNHSIGTLDRTYFFHANHVSGKASKMALLQKAFSSC
jgi:hypothetical protein